MTYDAEEFSYGEGHSRCDKLTLIAEGDEDSEILTAILREIKSAALSAWRFQNESHQDHF